MSDYAEIVVLVEGPTEKIFIADMVMPYLADRKVFMTPIILSKPGQKGGDVKFARAKNDIELHLKQRRDTYLTLFVDFYGIKNDWPGFEEAKRQTTPSNKANKVNQATKEKVEELFERQGATWRFIPYISMHEFEALLFSEPEILSQSLHVSRDEIDKILSKCGEPENIDDSSITAPSKRLEGLYERYKKTSTGITIANAIGLPTMREKCPLFDGWLTTVENLRGSNHA